MIGYKGFDKDMKCRNFQFEVGKTYETDKAELCQSGFHFCEFPMDCLTYYTPNNSIYAEIEADGVSEQKEQDSKRTCKKITIKRLLSLKEITSLCFNTNFESINKKDFGHSSAHGYSGHSSAHGNFGHSSAHGNFGHSSAHGYSGHSSAHGYSGHSSAHGNFGHSSAHGNFGHSSAHGNSGHSSAHGNSGHSSAHGNFGHSSAHGIYGHSSVHGIYGHSSAHGIYGIASALGINSTAQNIISNWIVLSEWNNDYELLWVKTAQIDGEKLKPNTPYKLVNGEFQEATK
jgi:hypothetical protein